VGFEMATLHTIRHGKQPLICERIQVEPNDQRLINGDKMSSV